MKRKKLNGEEESKKSLGKKEKRVLKNLKQVLQEENIVIITNNNEGT